MMKHKRLPRAFLCYASEDKLFVDKLAQMLSDYGIEPFDNQWEIQPGDSIRRKIDEGRTTKCTHFVFVMSPANVDKWCTNAEADAEFVRKVADQQALLPILYNVPIEKVSPLIAGLNCLPIDDELDGARQLIREIKGVLRKPKTEPKASEEDSCNNINKVESNPHTRLRHFIPNSVFARLDRDAHAQRLRDHIDRMHRIGAEQPLVVVLMHEIYDQHDLLINERLRDIAWPLESDHSPPKIIRARIFWPHRE